MTNYKAPIQRRKELYAISHDHHHCLVFCARLKGAKKIDIHTLQRFVADFWQKYLERHCRQEEEILLPYLSSSGLAARLIEDHLQHKNLIHAISLHPENAHTLAESLRKSLTEHIRFEERELLPWIETHCTPMQLMAIHTALNHSEPVAHSFNPPFWHP